MGKGFYVVTHSRLDEERPHYFVDDTDEVPLVIVNAEDPRWRIPPDEIRAMAAEIASERGNSEHAQSAEDRMKAVNERMLQHFERKGLITRGISVNRPIGRI